MVNNSTSRSKSLSASSEFRSLRVLTATRVVGSSGVRKSTVPKNTVSDMNGMSDDMKQLINYIFLRETTKHVFNVKTRFYNIIKKFVVEF